MLAVIKRFSHFLVNFLLHMRETAIFLFPVFNLTPNLNSPAPIFYKMDNVFSHFWPNFYCTCAEMATFSLPVSNVTSYLDSPGQIL